MNTDLSGEQGLHQPHSHFYINEYADLDRAIEIGEEALRSIPSSHDDRQGRLTNLANRLAGRYSHG